MFGMCPVVAFSVCVRLLCVMCPVVAFSVCEVTLCDVSCGSILCV